MATRARTVTGDDVRAVRAAVETVAKRTPILSSRTISERAGGTVALKAENLQRTGSFKIRGAAAKVASLPEADSGRGVVAASAGNHAQALAAAARRRGIPCEVFVPADAPIAKAEAARGHGATVYLGGTGVDDCIGRAQERAQEQGMTFVHPFDDPVIVAGQGSLGLELVEDVEDLKQVVVPVGGGGLASGIAIAVKSQRPDVRVVGVQVAACAPYPESLKRGEIVPVDSALTIADGIAVKRPGDVTLPLLKEWLDDLVVVGEDETAEAMAVLMERCKLVVEGAGAVGVAALLGGQVRPPASGTTVVVLSGGNVDAALLAAVVRRHDNEAGRRLVLLTRVPDRPGGLVGLLSLVSEAGANIVDVSHVREGIDLHVRETGVELVLETRGHEHAETVTGKLAAAGYEARVLR
jgi:threonine dehydratase